MNMTPSKNDENQIIELVRKIVQNSSLSRYADLWSKAGFAITRNYARTEYETPPLPFAAAPLSRQVSEFRIAENWFEAASAWRLIDLIVPLLVTRRYREYFDLWANAGFHITPIPPPPVENSEFKPNFFLLGAAKSGTTTLYTYLSKIPSVCMSVPKEPFFFEAEFELGLEHYRRRYFSHWTGAPLLGDARHRNLYIPFIAGRIFAVNPQAKLAICLRNPIERAYSHWWHWYSRKVEALAFEQAIREDLHRIQAGGSTATDQELDVYKAVLDSTGKGIYRTYVDSGYYQEQICRYLEFFPRDQIKVILFDDLQQNPYLVIKELESFIGTDYYQPDNFLPQKVNPHLPERDDIQRAPIALKFREFLADHFQEQNNQLAQLINRDLSHWR